MADAGKLDADCVDVLLEQRSEIQAIVNNYQDTHHYKASFIPNLLVTYHTDIDINAFLMFVKSKSMYTLG
ncbi:hypothetical protein [Methylotenera mobilis]|uniref:hypothetical protein n=1 Tax=Methylotenera mobilis TaxID=359408 RepID=UPI000376C45F|nr:hypothetical protein [Methylotenera mobilis]